MVLFVIGLLLGAAVAGVLGWRARRAAARIEEEKHSLLEERQVVLDFMHDMVDAVGERLTRDELFRRIVCTATRSTGALSACIFEKGADGLMRGVAVQGLFPPHRPIADTAGLEPATRAQFIDQVLRSESFPVGEGIVGRVAATGRGELIPDAPSDPRIVRHDDPALTVRSVIAAPIVVRGRLLGVLCVCNAADGLPFTATDYSLVAALAEQAGLAVHNADFLGLEVEKRQLDLDLSLASEVQQLLLPQQLPVVPGLDINARYLAAQRVSGDLYDVFPLDGGRLGVAVADVAGKGVSASLVMAICRTLLRQVAARHESPAQVLGELNRILAADVPAGKFVTMTYAVIDPVRGTLVLARAGHEPPLLVRAPGRAGGAAGGFIDAEGMPLGWVDAGMFAEVMTDRHLAIAPGDVLVLYTDGLTEAPNATGKEYSGARLADAVRAAVAATPGNAARINDAVLASVRIFTGETALRDDLTLVTVAVTR